MSNREALTQTEKEHVFYGKLQGRTLLELAAELDCSVATTRKWWREGRDRGLEGLRASRRGRGKSGLLSRFDPRVAEKAEAHKRAHPRWGADRVLMVSPLSVDAPKGSSDPVESAGYGGSAWSETPQLA